MVGLERGKVKLVEYDPTWQERFESEKQILQQAFSEVNNQQLSINNIYHVGSTAVPGLMAKPIIDIHLILNVFSGDYSHPKALIEILTPHDYHFRSNASTDTKIFFARGSEADRTVYLHIFEKGALDHLLSLAFRNYLRANEAIKNRYQQLKIKLSAEFSDNRESYTAAKSAFIQETSKTAYSEGYHLKNV